jgi:cytochrome c oxidase assembly protein subunit 11
MLIPNVKLALKLGVVVVFMTALSFASVPLYNMFCKVTGFGGTTGSATAPTGEMTDRTVSVTFNTDIDPTLPWRFTAEQKEITLKVGEEVLVFFDAENLSDTLSYGTSVFNVTPHKAGEYFIKTECFCYQEQAIEPHQVVKMPVSFYIDPQIMDDNNLDDVKNITLSYTFFKVKSEHSKN